MRDCARLAHLALQAAPSAQDCDKDCDGAGRHAGHLSPLRSMLRHAAGGPSPGGVAPTAPLIRARLVAAAHAACVDMARCTSLAATAPCVFTICAVCQQLLRPCASSPYCMLPVMEQGLRSCFIPAQGQQSMAMACNYLVLLPHKGCVRACCLRPARSPVLLWPAAWVLPGLPGFYGPAWFLRTLQGCKGHSGCTLL